MQNRGKHMAEYMRTEQEEVRNALVRASTDKQRIYLQITHMVCVLLAEKLYSEWRQSRSYRVYHFHRDTRESIKVVMSIRRRLGK